MDPVGKCRFCVFDDGLISLMFDDFEPLQEFFEEHSLEGGGYTWHAIIEAFVRIQKPQYLDIIDFDPESSMFVVRSESKEALTEIANFISKCQNNQQILLDTLKIADKQLLE